MSRYIQTDIGQVEIVTGMGAAEISSLPFHPGLGEFDDYRSILSCPAVLAREMGREQAKAALALMQGQILGYVVTRPPLPGDRWGQMPIMREIYCELARGMRGRNLMQVLLQDIHQDAELEHLICYLLGYSWHWDLKGTGRTMGQYRHSIISLVAPYNYKEYPTNDPNVGLHAENIFMARLGSHITPQEKRAFSKLLFGITE
jgi:acetoin utilization protein AcuA